MLYLSNPEGVSRDRRRMFLDDLSALNRIQQEEFLDPEIETRIAQYEMAYRMQTSVPELMDLSSEPESTFDLYGEAAREPGNLRAPLSGRTTFGGARRALHPTLPPRMGSATGQLPVQLPKQCADTDQASAALIEDLDQRGMLDETLVVWGGGVWTDGLLPGHHDQRDLWARSPPSLFHDLARRGRREAWRNLRRDGRVLATTLSTSRCTSTICMPPCCTS